MTIHLDLDTARTLALEVISEKPDGYTYELADAGCVYAAKGEPSCLVGQVLHRAGLPVEALVRLDRGSLEHWPELADRYEPGDYGAGFAKIAGEPDWITSTALESCAGTNRLAAVGVDLTPEALGWLRVAQAEQDCGVAWANAAAKADATVGR